MTCFPDYMFQLKKIWEVGMAQWWERSPPTNVTRFNSGPVPYLYVGWVCGFSIFQHAKFQFHQDRGPAGIPAKADVASSLKTCIIILLILFFKY